jgi:hypothetical protein
MLHEIQMKLAPAGTAILTNGGSLMALAIARSLFSARRREAHTSKGSGGLGK